MRRGETRYPEAEQRALWLHRERPLRPATDIWRQLAKELGVEAPSDPRPVIGWIARDKADQSGAWTLADDPHGDDARLILPVLTEVAGEYGLERHITREEAAWIPRIRRAAPDLPLLDVYRFALGYAGAARQAKETGHDDGLLFLDRQLAMRVNFKTSVYRQQTWAAVEARYPKESGR